jgi:capsular polysaccharide biosynthesis protein
MKISQIIIRKAAKNVASPIGISVRTYVFRNSNARVIGIQKENRIIGVLMVRNINREPKCYELQQFLIDIRYQNKVAKIICSHFICNNSIDNIKF